MGGAICRGVSGIGVIFAACGVFGDAVAFSGIELVVVGVIDFRNGIFDALFRGDLFSSFDSIALNCAINAFGEYNMLAEYLLKLDFCSLDAASVKLHGVDFVVNDNDNGETLIDGDNDGLGGKKGPADLLGVNNVVRVADLSLNDVVKISAIIVVHLARNRH